MQGWAEGKKKVLFLPGRLWALFPELITDAYSLSGES